MRPLLFLFLALALLFAAAPSGAQIPEKDCTSADTVCFENHTFGDGCRDDGSAHEYVGPEWYASSGVNGYVNTHEACTENEEQGWHQELEEKEAFVRVSPVSAKARVTQGEGYTNAGPNDRTNVYVQLGAPSTFLVAQHTIAHAPGGDTCETKITGFHLLGGFSETIECLVGGL